MTLPPRRARACALLGAAAIAASLALAATPAAAVTTVTSGGGAQWQIHDAERPSLDTGSIRALAGSRVDGYGNLFVRTGDADVRMDGQMARGFGLTEAEGGYVSTQSVPYGDAALTRRIDVADDADLLRFFDSVTNTGDADITVEVSFGGALGYGSGDQQGTIRASSETGPAWDVVAQPGDGQRPIGTLVGDYDRLGNQERDPFETPYVAEGQEANFYGYVHVIDVPAGESRSLMHFVATDEAGEGAVSAVAADLAELAGAPDVGGLSLDEVCSIDNWDIADEGCAETVRLDVPGVPDAAPAVTTSSYDVVDKTIAELQADMTAGVTTSVEITQAYLDRIAAYDGGQFGFHSFIAVADDALAQARAADEARAAGETGELLGIPIGIKDIYDTADMPTTGGSRALEGWTPEQDATQVALLREAGAVILGKTNTSEFAYSGGYSESGYMQTWNALYPSKTSFGSSGGSAVAVAADLTAAAMGSQTGVSLYAPAVGGSITTFRGTDGMASVAGVMPLTWGQDYAGPMAKTVTDLAMILNATTGSDERDILTVDADEHRPEDWTALLDEDALEGVRIGYLPGSFVSSWADDDTGAAALASLTELESAGASLVEISGSAPSLGRAPGGNRGDEGWARYIADNPSFPFESGAQLAADPRVLPYNTRAERAASPMTEEQVAAWIEYRAAAKEIYAEWMADNGVDVLVYPGFISDVFNNDGNTNQHTADRATGVPTSNAGLPTVVVPIGANGHGYSMSLQLVGTAWSDAEVLAMGYALEQQADARMRTAFAPALAVGDAGEEPTEPEQPGEPEEPTEPEEPGTPEEPAEPEEPGEGDTAPGVAEDSLLESLRGLITLPASVVAGEDVDVVVPSAEPGAELAGYLFSEPTELGVDVVSGAGIVVYTIPADTAAGEHRLAVATTEGDVIGWDYLTVLAPEAAGDAPELGVTGGTVSLLVVGLALAALAAGGTLLVVRRRAQRLPDVR